MKTRDSKANKVLRTAALSKNRMPALPVIALYYSEAKDILSGVQDDPEYQEWRKDFTRLFFTAGHFIISEKGKKEDQSMYFSFNAKSRTPHFSVFDHEGTLMARFSADIDNGGEIVSLLEQTRAAYEWAMPITTGRLGVTSINLNFPEKNSDCDSKIAALDARIKKIKSLPIMKEVEWHGDYVRFAKFDVTESGFNEFVKTKSEAERKLIAAMIQDVLDISEQKRQIINAEKSAIGNHLEDVMGRVISAFRSVIFDVFCSTMYYFHIRVPKFIDTQEVMTTEGYKKWNPDYNPIKRLQPPSVVRARNGTRSYLEQQRQRRTESWHVRGHLRRYKKTGLEVWITPYVKGTGDGLRLSVYADGVAATDVVTAE